jgi:two-component system, OmpR family, sensor histidine kinase KdpD
MDMNEPQATANLSRDRRAPIFHTSKGYAAIIGASALDAAVVREVHWLAKEAGLPLTIYMIGPTKPWLSALLTPHADQIKRLAVRLDARLISATPKNAVDVITNDWQESMPTQVVFGPRKRWAWDVGISRSLVNRLTSRAAENYNAEVQDAPIPHEVRPHVTWRLDRHRPWYHDYVFSLFAVCIAALSVQWLKNLMPAENLSIVFLTAVIFSATAYGFAAALFSSLISVALFDFFFVSPAFSFSFSSPDNVLLVILFVLMSGITSNLAGRLRDQAEAAQQREGEARALFQLTRDIATSDTPEDTYAAVVRQSAALFDIETVVLLPHRRLSGSESGRGPQAPLADGNSSHNDPTALQPVYPPQAGL